MDIKKMLNEKNVSEKDSVARLTVGTMFFAGGLFNGSIVITIIGSLAIITGIRKNCLIYSIRNKKK